MVGTQVGDFKQAWESLGDGNQVSETFQLSMKSLAGWFFFVYFESLSFQTSQIIIISPPWFEQRP